MHKQQFDRFWIWIWAPITLAVVCYVLTGLTSAFLRDAHWFIWFFNSTLFFAGILFLGLLIVIIASWKQGKKGQASLPNRIVGVAVLLPCIAFSFFKPSLFVLDGFGTRSFTRTEVVHSMSLKHGKNLACSYDVSFGTPVEWYQASCATLRNITGSRSRMKNVERAYVLTVLPHEKFILSVTPVP